MINYGEKNFYFNQKPNKKFFKIAQNLCILLTNLSILC